MLRVAAAVLDWFAGIEILAVIAYLNWLFQPGEAFSALTCLTAVSLFAVFGGMASSVVFCLAANLGFAVLLLAPRNGPEAVNAHIVLTVVALLVSSLTLVLLIHRLRTLNTLARDTKAGDATQRMGNRHTIGQPAPVRFSAVMDLTDEKLAEDGVRDIRAFLVEEMRLTALEELSASIAHEIAQPLSAIVLDGQACLRWARQDNPPQHEIQDCVERMTSDGRRASDTIRRIREQCRRAPPQLIRTAMNDVVREIAPLITREMAACGARLELRLSPSIPYTLADSSKLQQVFMNLAQNALQAMSGMKDRPAQIVISSRTTETGAVAISVADNGPGIAGVDLSQIFEPFSTTREGALGLGLSICRSIVEAHSGEISVTNNADHGATFEVTLPPVSWDRVGAESTKGSSEPGDLLFEDRVDDRVRCVGDEIKTVAFGFDQFLTDLRAGFLLSRRAGDDDACPGKFTAASSRR